MSRTRGRVFTILFTALLLAGLFLAYDASKHTESRYDVSITQEVQAWDVPGLDRALRFISEFTNFFPGLAIWTAVVAIFIWRGLRVEALVLLMAVVTFVGAEALVSSWTGLARLLNRLTCPNPWWEIAFPAAMSLLRWFSMACSPP